MAIISVPTHYLGPLGHYAPAPLAGAPDIYRQLAVMGRFSVRAGTGAGTISDVVTIDGQPVVRRVRAFSQTSGALLAETWSAADGTYTLRGLSPGWPVTVIADDHTGVYNSVVAAWVTAS